MAVQLIKVTSDKQRSRIRFFVVRECVKTG